MRRRRWKFVGYSDDSGSSRQAGRPPICGRKALRHSYLEGGCGPELPALADDVALVHAQLVDGHAARMWEQGGSQWEGERENDELMH